MSTVPEIALTHWISFLYNTYNNKNLMLQISWESGKIEDK